MYIKSKHHTHLQLHNYFCSLKMDEITHKFIQVNGLKLHVAEIGSSESSPAVIFLHGFPEIWYTWRHQMTAVAKAGFRVIAPDFRGYGLSDAPAEPEKASFADLVSDTASILDSLTIAKAFVIAKDFGGWVAYALALLHPDKVAGIITSNVLFLPPGAFDKFVFPEGFYVSRWQTPGRAEADFARLDVKTVVRNIYIMFSQSEMPIAAENEEIMDLVKPSTPLPSWMTEEDIATYGSLYEKNGFQTALQVPYRTMLTVGSEVPADPKIEVPTLVIMGEKDYGMKVPGIMEYVRSGVVKKYVPNHETIFVPDGCHFLHEQFPDHVNQLILAFLDRNKHLAL